MAQLLHKKFNTKFDVLLGYLLWIDKFKIIMNYKSKLLNLLILYNYIKKLIIC